MPPLAAVLLTAEPWPQTTTSTPPVPLVLAPPAEVAARTGSPAARSGRRLELARLSHERLEAARDADPDERQALLDQVATDHLWLAETLARRFRYRGEEADDLLQVARIGLVEACLRYEPGHGPFLAFAVPTITGVLRRHFRDHGWVIRPPRRTQELATTLWQQWPTVVQDLGAIPNEAELAGLLGEPVTAVRAARFASQGYASSSLDAALLHGIEPGSADGDAATERCEARLVVASVWDRLDGPERRLLRMRFYEERSQADIAVELGTSQMQVSRLLARLLVKLRGMIGTLDPLPPAVARVA